LGVEHTNAGKLRLRSSVAYNSSSNGLNTVPENSPDWIGKFFLSAPLIGEAVYLAGDVQTISGQNYNWSNTQYNVGTEWLANATLTFPNVLAKGLQAQLRVTNLFDRHVLYPSSPDMATPTTPGLGRNLAASITYEF
jgi:outer membrane receptor for ferric coprogen and ferric-rhodotorulic acid